MFTGRQMLKTRICNASSPCRVGMIHTGQVLKKRTPTYYFVNLCSEKWVLREKSHLWFLKKYVCLNYVHVFYVHEHESPRCQTLKKQGWDKWILATQITTNAGQNFFSFFFFWGGGPPLYNPCCPGTQRSTCLCLRVCMPPHLEYDMVLTIEPSLLSLYFL